MDIIRTTFEQKNDIIAHAIANIKTSAFEIGKQLAEIRDSKLYKCQYATFEDYCLSHWGFSRSRAYRLINGSEIVADMLPIGDILPTNEAQARALGAIKNTEERQKIWAIAVGKYGQNVTASIIEDIAEERAKIQQTKEGRRLLAEALKEIKEGRLHEIDGLTFAQYTQSLGIGESLANELIATLMRE